MADPRGTANGAPADKSADPNDLSDRNYIRWDAEGVEYIPEGEEEDIQAVADQINAIQRAQWNVHRHAFSGKTVFSPPAVWPDV